MNVCIVQPNKRTPSETFLRAHAERLPANVTVLHGLRPRASGGRMNIRQRLERISIRIQRYWLRESTQWEITHLLPTWFREYHPDVVLAQYGPTGVRVMEACRKARIPLLVYFRGFDANNHSILESYGDGYRRLFQQAAGVIAVSQAMRQKLIDLGAPADKTHHIPSGACCDRFYGAHPAEAGPVFLTVGRFIECKGGVYVIDALSRVIKQVPTVRLRMIGDGELLDACRRFARGLGVDHAVTFLGVQSHDCVADEMRRARALIHPSIVAPTGDAEGTPVTVMEAGASGLPVIGTRVGGIPEVVLHEQTGLLVEQRDAAGLAEQMLRLAIDPAFASRLGQAASERVRAHFSLERSIQKLWSLMQSCVADAGHSSRRAAA